jgi:type I restriction enzyme S subunit
MTKLLTNDDAIERGVSLVAIGDLALNNNGAFRIGPFGSSLKKGELTPEGIAVVGIENVHPNKFVKCFRRFIPPKKFKELADYSILPKDILVTTMGTIGRAAVAPADLGDAIIDSHLFRMRVDEKRVLPEYLCFALNSTLVVRQLSQKARGAIMDGLNTTILKSCIIPLPSLSVQTDIVAILNRANRLRLACHYAIEISNDFLMAEFVRRFEDVLKGPSAHKLGELVTITGGSTPSRDNPKYFTGKIPWLTSKDMRADYIFDTEEHITAEAIEISAAKLVPGGSILIVVKSKVLMHRLPLAVAMVDLCHGQDIKSIQCGPKLNGEFARFLLKYHEPRLLNMARGANTEGLTLPMLQELSVPEVKLDKQLKFASLVEAQTKFRYSEIETLRQADHLYESLLQKYFH